MNIVRSILAVVTGYVVLSVLVVGTTLTLRLVLPEITIQPPPFNYALLILAYVTVFAVVAGYVTAIVARRAKVFHALALAVLLLLFGVLSVESTSDGGRLWFPIANGALQFIAAVAGGYLSARRNYGALQSTMNDTP